jgi:hypothetical protein
MHIYYKPKAYFSYEFKKIAENVSGVVSAELKKTASRVAGKAKRMLNQSMSE